MEAVRYIHIHRTKKNRVNNINIFTFLIDYIQILFSAPRLICLVAERFAVTAGGGSAWLYMCDTNSQ